VRESCLVGSRRAGGCVAAGCYTRWTAPPAAVAPFLNDPAAARQPRVRHPGLGGPFPRSDQFVCMRFCSNRLTAAQPRTPSVHFLREALSGTSPRADHGGVFLSSVQRPWRPWEAAKAGLWSRVGGCLRAVLPTRHAYPGHHPEAAAAPPARQGRLS